MLIVSRSIFFRDVHRTAVLAGYRGNGGTNYDASLKPHQKAHLMLTLTAPPDGRSSNFTVHYHETAPRPGARFTIDGLKVQPAGSPSLY